MTAPTQNIGFVTPKHKSKLVRSGFIMGICRPLSIMLLLYAFINPRFRDDSYDAWHWESVKQQSLNKNGLLN